MALIRGDENINSSINQVNHGFVSGDVIVYNYSESKYQLATYNFAPPYFVVDSVSDANSFIMLYAGIADSLALPEGTYYLDITNTGKLTTTVNSEYNPIAVSIQGKVYLLSSKGLPKTASNAPEALFKSGEQTVYTDQYGVVYHTPVWNDYISPFSVAKVTGNSSPPYQETSNGFFDYVFEESKDYSLQLSYHIEHDYMENSKIFPHIHIEPLANTSGDIVLNYTYRYGKRGEAFTAPSTVQQILSIPTNSQNKHLVFEDLQGLLLGIEEDTILQIIVQREGTNILDTFNDDFAGLNFDLHYRKNKLGTISKEAPFNTPI